MKVNIELNTADPADLAALARMFTLPVAVPEPAAPRVYDLSAPGYPVPADPVVTTGYVQTAPLCSEEALQAQGMSSTLARAVVQVVSKQPAKPPAKPKARRKRKPRKRAKAKGKASPAAVKLAERGKAMTKAAEDLGSVVGERPKLSTVETAKIAAKARWANKAKAPTQPSQPRDPAKPKPAAKAAPKPVPKPKPVAKPVAKKKPAPRPEPKPQDYSKAVEQDVADYPVVSGGEVRQTTDEDDVPAFPDGRELIEGTFKLPKQPEEPAHEQTIDDIAREYGGVPHPDPLDEAEPLAPGDEPVPGV